MPPAAFTARTSCCSIFFSLMSALSEPLFLLSDIENLLFLGFPDFCHSVMHPKGIKGYIRKNRKKE
jgi:hypothetical protein